MGKKKPVFDDTDSFDSLPKGWQVSPLEDFVDADKSSLNPQDYPKESFDYYSIPAYQISIHPDIEQGCKILSQKLLVETGTVLFGKLNPRVPKVWQICLESERRKIASTEFIPLSPVPNKADSDFLYFLCWSGRVMKAAQELVSGSTPSRQRTDVRAFLQLSVALPPLPEQRAIAEVLRTVQRAKEATEKVIAACRQLKQSLMHHLFTYGTVPYDQADKVELKETEIGEMPKHWKTTRLGDIARIGNGSTPRRTNDTYWNGGTLPWLTSGKVHERFIEHADEFITQQARDECHLPLVKKGSLVVAITGQGKTLGNAAIVGFETCVSQHLAYIQLHDSSINGEFLLGFLHRQYAHFRQVSSGGGIRKEL